jgi:hypothetical protein
MEETALEIVITNRLKIAIEEIGGRFTKNNNYNVPAANIKLYATSPILTSCQ